MSAIGLLRDPATCLHAVHTADQRYGKDLDKSPVMRGKCMWCDLELKAPMGRGFGRGYEYVAKAQLRSAASGAEDPATGAA